MKCHSGLDPESHYVMRGEIAAQGRDDSKTFETIQI
jgi:hypothetical protein